MSNAHRINRNLWVVGDPRTPLAITASGPYKNRASVDRAGRQLTGVENTERGGLYMVAAPVRANLSQAIHSVAACLSQRLAGAQQTF